MRFFEINEPNTPPAPQTGVPPVDATKEPHPADKQPAAPAQLKAKVKRKGDGPFVINDVTYANRTDQDAEVAAIKAALIDEFPSVNVRNDLEDINAGKKIPKMQVINWLIQKTMCRLYPKHIKILSIHLPRITSSLLLLLRAKVQVKDKKANAKLVFKCCALRSLGSKASTLLNQN